jgi:antiviral helicase SKI2
MSELHAMMQGRPTRLESKFRLTYSMILNLLRVEQLRVEDMMKRSFSEIDNQKKQGDYKDRIKRLKKELESLPQPSGASKEKLEEFYKLSNDYATMWDKYASLLLSHPVSVKLLVPGRVLVVFDQSGRLRLGVLLETDTKSKERSYSVLVRKTMDDGGNRVQEARLNRTLSMASLSLAIPDMSDGHTIIKVSPQDFLEVAAKAMAKIDPAKVIADVRQREDIPRFRGNPPGQSTSLALQVS